MFGLFGVLEVNFGNGWAQIWILRGLLWFCMWLWGPTSRNLRFWWLPNGVQNEAENQQIATKSREKKIVAKRSKKGQIPDPLIARRKGSRPYGSHIFTFTEVSKKWSKKKWFLRFNNFVEIVIFGEKWVKIGPKWQKWVYKHTCRISDFQKNKHQKFKKFKNPRISKKSATRVVK